MDAGAFPDGQGQAGRLEQLVRQPDARAVAEAGGAVLVADADLDEAILTEEEMLKRRQRLKMLIKLGKTRGYLTHAEITDHLPEKLVDARWGQITVRQLLFHTAGFDRNASFDPMFRSDEIAKATKTTPPAGPMAILRYMLAQPLDFEPGARFAYSNFGYCLLGRAIEKVSGRPASS